MGEKKGLVGSGQKSGSGPGQYETLDASSGVEAGIRPAQDRSDDQREETLQAQRSLYIYLCLKMCNEIIVSNMTFLLSHVSAAEEENIVACSSNLQPDLFCLIQLRALSPTEHQLKALKWKDFLVN